MELKELKTYTYEEVKDYMRCPLCYHIEHVEREKVSTDYYREHQRIASDKAMLSAVYYYYFRHLEGNPPSLKEMYNKYYRELNRLSGEPMDKKFITDTVTNSQGRSTVRNGYKWIRMFYEWNAKTPQAVISVNHPFYLEYEELRIEDTFPILREIQNDKGQREIELLMFGQTSKNSPEASLVQDTDATILLKGFQEAFEMNPDSFRLFSLEKGKAYDIYRNESDLKRLESSFLGFYQSVNNVAPYQRLSAHPYHGKFKHLCDAYYE